MLLKDKKIFAFFARKFYFTSFIVALTIILITLILFFANKSMLYNDIEEKFNVTLKFIQHKRADMFASLEDLKEGILVSKNEYKIKQILDIKIKTNEYFDAIFYVKDDLVIHSELNKFSFPSDFVARDFDDRLDENNFYLSNFIFLHNDYRLFVVKKNKIDNGYIVAFINNKFFKNIRFFDDIVFFIDKNGEYFSNGTNGNIYNVYSDKFDFSKKQKVMFLKDNIGKFNILYFDKLNSSEFFICIQRSFFDEFNYINILFLTVVFVFFVISYLFFRNFRFLVKNLFLPLDEFKRLAMLKHRIKKVSPLISDSEFFGEFSEEILEFFNEKIYNMTFDKRFNDIFKKSELYVLIINSQTGMIVQASDVAKELYGKDICQKNIFEIEAMDIFESSVFKFKNSENLDNTIHKIDDKFIKISYQKSHFYVNDIAYVMYIIFDNSKYINMLDQISEEYTIINTSPQLIVKYDLKCEKLINISENSKDILGVTRGEILKNNIDFFDFIYQKDINVIKNKIYNLSMLGIKNDKFIVKLKHKIGVFKYFEITCLVDKYATLYLQDIDKFVIKNKAIKKNIQFYKDIIDTKNIISWQLDVEKEFVKFNDNFYKLLNYDKFDKYEMKFDDFLNFILLDDLEEFRNSIFECLSGKKHSFEIQIRVKNSLNEIFWLFIHGSIIKKKNNTVSQIGGIIENITVSKDTETKLNLSDSVFDNSLEGIAICDKNWQIIRLNEAFEMISGYDKESIKNISLNEFFVNEIFYNNIIKAIQKNYFYKGEGYILNKNGEKIPVILMINEIVNNKELFYVIMFSEIAQIKNREKVLTQIANIDFLTQIPNRFYFTKLVKDTLKHYDFSEHSLAILFIDFDNFKNINDNFGHEIGDEFLKQATHRIKEVLRNNDILARLGGDEFGILILDIKEKFTINRILERINQNLKLEFNINGNIIQTSASIGVALYDGNSQISFEELLNMADNAMYFVKKNNKGGVHIFDISNQEKHHIKQQQIENSIENDDFFMVYQPIISTKDYKIDSYELLLRWDNKHIGKLSPKEFLPDIKDIFSEQLLSMFSFEKLVWLLLNKTEKGNINISMEQLCNYEFFEFVQDKILHNTTLRNKKIIFEITNFDEKSLENFIDCHKKYINLGIKFAINNANLQNLKFIKKLPISIIKLDINIALNIGKTFNATTEFKEILKLRKKNYAIIIQGIESKFMLKVLRSLNVDYLQGNIIQEPMPQEQISDFENKFANLQICKFKDEISEFNIINLLDFKTICTEFINLYKMQGLNVEKFTNFKQLFSKLHINFKSAKNSNLEINTEINKQILDILSTNYENLNDFIFKFNDFFTTFQNELENL